jgi:uncharacterized protein (TIGR02217 family)
MFHDTRFPTAISRAAHGGPERRTDVVVLGSGAEERNARWANSRRAWNAGWGVKSLNDLHAVIAFFEERRGRLHGFRWRDPSDWKSCPPENTPTALDQQIGLGDGSLAAFQLAKTYGSAFNPWTRAIKKPVAGTVLIAVNGVLQTPARTTPSTTPPASSPSPATSPPRRRRHRRLRVRRARPLRHRQARDQPARLPPRRHPLDPHRRDPRVRLVIPRHSRSGIQGQAARPRLVLVASLVPADCAIAHPRR